MHVSIYHDKEAMKEIAILKAKEHDCNYNVIIACPLNGEFNRAHGSTYEFVADSYFKNHPDALVIFKTDDVLKSVPPITENTIEPFIPTLDMLPILDVSTCRGEFPHSLKRKYNNRYKKK